jgi:hypothetical protein
MKPSYAHVPDPNAGGTCGQCKHAACNRKTYNGPRAYILTCTKAVELARYSGSGAPIKAATQGCKYWEFTFREGM